MKIFEQFLKKKTFTREIKIVAENFISLSFLQAANYILPLITLPYLVRVLGPEKFGLIAFAQALMQYFIIFTDYGFNFSATRNISMYRENTVEVSNIFTSVMVIKLFFSMISFIFIGMLIYFIPKLKNDALLYLYTFGMVVGTILFPTWFFQGMERMKYVTFLNIAGKVIFTISIFIFVRKQQDFLYVPLLTSLGYIITGVASLWVVFDKFRVRFALQGYEHIKNQLKEGWHSFLFTISITSYTNTNTFVLGLLTNNAIVGYYSAAEKLISAAQKIIGPMSQSVYPYVSKLAVESKEKAAKFLQTLTNFFGIAFFILSLTFLFLAVPIVNIILGPKYHESIIILKIMSFLPFIITLSNIFAIQGLIAFGHQKVVTAFVSLTAIIYIPAMVFMTYCFHQVGTAISVLIMEIVLMLFSRWYYFAILDEYNV